MTHTATPSEEIAIIELLKMNEHEKYVGKICSFSRDCAFLSNFYNCNINYNEVIYKNAESAFQAQKTVDSFLRIAFANMNPKEAKRAGRRLALRNDWESVKVTEMYNIVNAKFRQNPELAKKLISTKNFYLEEGNTWGDSFWGVCNGYGKNQLGLILMQVRKELEEV